jgi:hypothetical protein
MLEEQFSTTKKFSVNALTNLYFFIEVDDGKAYSCVYCRRSGRLKNTFKKCKDSYTNVFNH